MDAQVTDTPASSSCSGGLAPDLGTCERGLYWADCGGSGPESVLGCSEGNGACWWFIGGERLCEDARSPDGRLLGLTGTVRLNQLPTLEAITSLHGEAELTRSDGLAIHVTF